MINGVEFMHTNTKLMETNAGHNQPLYFLR